MKLRKISVLTTPKTANGSKYSRVDLSIYLSIYLRDEITDFDKSQKNSTA